MTEVGQAVVSEGEQDWGAPRAKTVQWYDPAITAAAAAGWACPAWNSSARSGTASCRRRRSRR